MSTPTPAEQIARFVEQHPGEWQTNTSGGVTLPLTRNPDLTLSPHAAGIEITLTIDGRAVTHVGVVRSGDAIMPCLVPRVCSVLHAYHGTCDTLPSWLADPVRRELRRRAGELLTLAGSSPADVVSAAETLDEYLAARPPVPMDAGAICNTLMEIGMSCRWVADPATSAPKADPEFYRALLDATKPPETP